MARLPVPGSDNNTWGTILNDYLSVEHAADGTLKPGGSLATKADVTYVDNAVAASAIVVNVSDYGAAGDGTTDDTTAIRNAVAAAATTLGTVILPANHRVTGTITIPEGVTVQGAGDIARVTVAAGFNFPVFLIDGTRGTVQNIAIVKAAGAVAGANGNAVRVAGNSDGSRIINVTADGMSAGFYIAGSLGATPGTVTRIALDRCRALNSNVYGYEVDDCTGLELSHCTSTVSGLDGVKLRKKTLNVLVTGGYFTGAAGGDGMDCYAGGDTLTIQGASFVNNTLNGLVIKNDSLNRDDSANYGYVRSANVIGIMSTGNGGSGIACHRASGDDPTVPLVHSVNFVGCQLHSNGNYGLYLNARSVTMTAVAARRNGLDGIYMEPTCRDVDMLGCHVAGNSIGNGFALAGTRDGLHINGSRIRIIGGSSNGTDPDGALDDADLAAATKTQRYGLRVEAAATEVDIFGLNTLNNLTAATSDLSAGVRVASPALGVNFLDTGGKYIVPGGIRSTLPMLASVEYAVPMWLGNGGTVARIGCEITVAGTAGTVIRLGIRSSANHVPSTVLGEATVAGDAIASVEATVSIVVPSAGLYWLTATAQNTGGVLPTMRATTGNLAPVWSGSLINALSAAALAGHQTAATVTGTLPATYTISNRLAAAPLITIRI